MKRRTYKLNDSNRLQLLTKPLSLLYEIGFIDYRSRFHISRLFYSKVFNRGAAAVIVLGVVSFLYVFVGTQKSAKYRIIDTPIHIDEVELIQHLMPHATTVQTQWC